MNKNTKERLWGFKEITHYLGYSIKVKPTLEKIAKGYKVSIAVIEEFQPHFTPTTGGMSQTTLEVGVYRTRTESIKKIKEIMDTITIEDLLIGGMNQ